MTPAHRTRRTPSVVGRLAACALLVGLAACSSEPTAPGPSRPQATASSSTSAIPTSSPATSTATTTASPTASPSATATEPADVVTGLDVPWSVVVLPDGSTLVSERESGQVKRLSSGAATSIGTVPGVAAGGEGGLLGLAVDSATFAADPVVYAYLTSASDNRVVAMPYAGGSLGAPRTVLTGIPKSGTHNGGRLAFGPDGFLYVTTGDAGNRAAAQDRGALGGKILRVTTAGAPAPGNPFGDSPVWSMGHRNVQGIAWDPSGRMWASEFGQDTWDELNVITPGANYGWPTVEGQAGRAGFVDPVRQWATDDASPSGIAIGPDGAVLIAALKGQSLWKVPVAADGSTGEPQRLLQGEFGRLRDVLVGPDGDIWVVTNNTSRGTPRAGDDRIVRLPRALTG